MRDFRETFRERLDDHEFRDAIYDLILELTKENEDLRKEAAVKFKKLSETAIAPTKAHTFDAGWDLYADEHIAIPPGCSQIVKTGIAFDIPQGFAGLIWPRSGLSAKYGIDILGGVVDSGYQGEVKVVLANTSNFTWTAAPGVRMAQIVFHSVLLGGMFEVEEFRDETTRGDRGFGSTGE